MKKCEESQEMISEYVDNELADNETSKLFFHLGECIQCRTFMKSVLLLHNALKEIEAPVQDSSMKKTSVWKRKFLISYPVAAIFALFMFISTALFVQSVFFIQERSNEEHVEYISSKPLPTVYVIEFTESETHFN